MPLVTPALLLAVGVTGCFLASRFAENPKLDVMLLLSLLVTGGAFAGSDTGLYKMTSGAWTLLPLGILLLDRFGREELPGLSRMAILHPTILALTFAAGTVLHVNRITRDNPSRLALTTTFSHPSLRGIFSTKARVDALDGLLFEIERRTDPGDFVASAGTIPVIYFSTQTRRALGRLWLRAAGMDLVRERCNLARKRIPKLFIFTLQDATSPFWPDADENRTRRFVRRVDEEKFFYIRDFFVEQLRFRPVWKNDMFVICVPPDEADPASIAEEGGTR